MVKSMVNNNKINSDWLLTKSFFLIFFSIILFSSSIYAQQNIQKEPKTILDYTKDLGLTENQVDRIKVYIYDLKKELNDLRVKLDSVNREIIKLLEEGSEKQGSLKLSEVEKKVKEAFEIRAQMAIAEIRTAEKINEALTPDQFKKWKEIIKERKSKKND